MAAAKKPTAGQRRAKKVATRKADPSLASKEAAAAPAALAAAKSSGVDSLRKEIATLRSRVASMEATCRTRTKERDAAVAELEVLEQTHGEMRSAIEDSSKDWHVEHSKLTTELQMAREENKALHGLCNELKATVASGAPELLMDMPSEPVEMADAAVFKVAKNITIGWNGCRAKLFAGDIIEKRLYGGNAGIEKLLGMGVRLIPMPN
jgi:hypothetical protein